MLYNFLLNFVEYFSFLNVFKYITFRTGLSVFTSLFIVLVIGSPFIKYFSTRKILNPIRSDGPSDHIIKKIGTPTMGGVIILFGLLAAVILWGDLKNVTNPNNEYHEEFLKILEEMAGLPYFTNNFNHLTDPKINLI